MQYTVLFQSPEPREATAVVQDEVWPSWRRHSPVLASPFTRTAPVPIAGQLDMRSPGRMENSGKASGFTWDSTKKLTTLNAPRLLELSSQMTTPKRITIFTDAQAAIRRRASDEPGPKQKYAIQARTLIATLRRSRH